MNRTTLNKATSPDSTPTPGYLFDEIAKVTHDPIGNQRLVEYFVKRLESPSADVKAKVLNIIKHVCRKGNPSFRREWQREAGVIKAHLQFHTVPDPLRGDEPSRRVRENAKEALEAVFDASRDERRTDPALAGRIQGFGVAPPAPPSAQQQTHYPSASSSSSSSPARSQPRYSSNSRYEGIGNPNFQDPRNQPKGLLERVADVVREKVEKQAESIPGIGGVKPAWMTQDRPQGYNFASNRGPSNYTATMGSYDPAAAQRPQVQSTWSDPRSPKPLAATNGTGRVAATRTYRTNEPSDGTYERSLIDELCAPGGMRAVPPKDKLDAFCKACRTFDPNIVVDLLDEKMSASEDWKVQHKALCVLEAILQTPSLDEYADRMDQNPDNLEALYTSKNPSVRERAQTVWKLLYDDITEGNNDNIGLHQYDAAHSPAPTIDPAHNMNLLDFGETSVLSPQAPIQESMFASLSKPQGNQQTVSQQATSQAGFNMFASLTQPVVPTATQQVAASPLDMFTSLSQPSNTQNKSHTAASLLEGFSAPQGIPPKQPASSSSMPSMFENLSIKGKTSPLPVATASPAPPSSGFTFISPTPSVPAHSTNLMDFPPPTSTTKPQQSTDMLDLFSIPIQTSATTTVPAFPPTQIAPQQTKPLHTSQPAPQKKADSFGFVQEALQAKRT